MIKTTNQINKVKIKNYQQLNNLLLYRFKLKFQSKTISASLKVEIQIWLLKWKNRIWQELEKYFKTPMMNKNKFKSNRISKNQICLSLFKNPLVMVSKFLKTQIKVIKLQIISKLKILKVILLKF